jgi:hypothetical protein
VIRGLVVAVLLVGGAAAVTASSIGAVTIPPLHT